MLLLNNKLLRKYITHTSCHTQIECIIITRAEVGKTNFFTISTATCCRLHGEDQLKLVGKGGVGMGVGVVELNSNTRVLVEKQNLSLFLTLGTE